MLARPLLLTLLPAPWLSRVPPSCILIVQVLLLCAVQVALGRALAYLRTEVRQEITRNCTEGHDGVPFQISEAGGCPG